MKKTLVSALTTALVVGAASTTFAASNPFSDVPADHWAYDAVSQLAADGVIEGYGDSTFQGEKNITRYEMAQMIARAMAKKDVSAADKAMIDKLAAEFADELNNLGVRVANLEKHADNVKMTGELRYSYSSKREEGKHRENSDTLQFRIYPSAEVNDHWKVNARLTGKLDPSKDSGKTGDMELSYAYAWGSYKNFDVKLGKQELYSVADDGLIVDDFFSGAQVIFGNQLKTTLEAGRYSDAFADAGDLAANYQGIELNYGLNKFRVGAAYRHFNDDAIRDLTLTQAYKDSGTTDDANIWSLGAGYKFDKNVDLFAAYANNTEADNYDKAYNITLTYKKGDRINAGTWGGHIGYHYLGQNTAFMSTYDTALVPNTKGFEYELEYTPFAHTWANIAYFQGKKLDNDNDVKVLWGRMSYFF
ncbi:MAG: S-layer homology domain-containing protein [Selenomonadaceae bacterium]|nr:S-layer homology domain-containing protein [Selenomonadaceae bacterium]